MPNRSRLSHGARLRWATAGLVLLGACAALADQESSAPDDLQAVLDAVHARCRPLSSGRNADYIPALEAADPEHFGIAVVSVDGELYEVGDAHVPFAIMSIAKAFTVARLIEQRGPRLVRERIGVEPTGLPFNALLDERLAAGRPINPMVNAGAIAAISFLDEEDRWARLLGFYRRLAGADLEVQGEVFASVRTSNHRNRGLAQLLKSHGRLRGDPAAVLEVYDRQSCVAVTAAQLARMGAVLANGGLVPGADERVLAADHVDEVLALMLTCGMYDGAGRWAYEVGLPAKSGVGGGVLAIVPGRMAIAAFSPRLDDNGNSVRACAAIQEIAEELRLGLFTVPLER